MSSSLEASPDRSLVVEHERFVRLTHSTSLRLSVRPRSERFRISIDHSFLEGVTLSQITPPPLMALAGAEATWFEFAADVVDRPVVVTVDFQPLRFGPRRATIGLADGQAVHIDQWVHP